MTRGIEIETAGHKGEPLLSHDANLLVCYRADWACNGELGSAAVWVVLPGPQDGGASRAPAVRLTAPFAAADAVQSP